MRLLLPLFFILTACDQRVQLTKSKGVIHLTNIQAEISDAKLQPWKVGLKKEEEVSMGFVVKIGIPKIGSEELKQITEAYPIDSWAYRVVHEYQGRSNELGLVYLPFSSVIKSTDDFTIRIYYHAAVVSDRFRKFNCPAFGHRKRVTDYDLTDSEGKHELFIAQKPSLLITDHVFDHEPTVLSVGSRMEGTYKVQIALYSHSERRPYSNFIDLGNTIVVNKEQEIKVTSCIGIKEETEPLPNNQEIRIEDLQINK